MHKNSSFVEKDEDYDSDDRELDAILKEESSDELDDEIHYRRQLRRKCSDDKEKTDNISIKTQNDTSKTQHQRSESPDISVNTKQHLNKAR